MGVMGEGERGTGLGSGQQEIFLYYIPSVDWACSPNPSRGI